MKFDKELFKRSVLYNVKTLYRKTLEEASAQQIFQAVSYAIKDQIVENWMNTQKAYEKEDPKMVYYMSMEFLMGRALGNNMINMQAYDEVKEALDELGLDLNVVEDQEPDAALGNGGLGRLAACFLDSLATLGYPAYGCGIRYRYGMFKQQIRDGYQVEVPDNWLVDGNPFELRRPEYAKTVKFGGYVTVRHENGRNYFSQEGYQSVKAIPFDLPIVGYGNGIVNTLRIWDAEAVECFSLDSFGGFLSGALLLLSFLPWVPLPPTDPSTSEVTCRPSLQGLYVDTTCSSWIPITATTHSGLSSGQKHIPPQITVTCTPVLNPPRLQAS